MITKLITVDLNLSLKCEVFCCQSARALSLPLHKLVSQVVAMETNRNHSMKVFLRLKDLHACKICESVGYIRLQAQEKICKCVNRVLSAIKKYLQHFAVTRKCNSCFVKLQLHADT